MDDECHLGAELIQRVRHQRHHLLAIHAYERPTRRCGVEQRSEDVEHCADAERFAHGYDVFHRRVKVGPAQAESGPGERVTIGEAEHCVWGCVCGRHSIEGCSLVRG